jgi:hypothetical protein
MRPFPASIPDGRDVKNRYPRGVSWRYPHWAYSRLAGLPFAPAGYSLGSVGSSLSDLDLVHWDSIGLEEDDRQGTPVYSIRKATAWLNLERSLVSILRALGLDVEYYSDYLPSRENYSETFMSSQAARRQGSFALKKFRWLLGLFALVIARKERDKFLVLLSAGDPGVKSAADYRELRSQARLSWISELRSHGSVSGRLLDELQVSSVLDFSPRAHRVGVFVDAASLPDWHSSLPAFFYASVPVYVAWGQRGELLGPSYPQSDDLREMRPSQLAISQAYAALELNAIEPSDYSGSVQSLTQMAFSTGKQPIPQSTRRDFIRVAQPGINVFRAPFIGETFHAYQWAKFQATAEHMANVETSEERQTRLAREERARRWSMPLKSSPDTVYTWTKVWDSEAATRECVPKEGYEQAFADCHSSPWEVRYNSVIREWDIACGILPPPQEYAVDFATAEAEDLDDAEFGERAVDVAADQYMSTHDPLWKAEDFGQTTLSDSDAARFEPSTLAEGAEDNTQRSSASAAFVPYAHLPFPPALNVLCGRLGYCPSSSSRTTASTLSFAEACDACGYPLRENTERGIRDISEFLGLHNDLDRNRFTAFVSDMLAYGSACGKEKDAVVKEAQRQMKHAKGKGKQPSEPRKPTARQVLDRSLPGTVPVHRKQGQYSGGQDPTSSSNQHWALPAKEHLPSANVWAFHPANYESSKQRLIGLKYFSLEKWWFPRVKQPVWMIDEISSPRRSRDWVLVLHDPHVVVDVLMDGFNKSLETLAMHCFEAGIRFETVQLAEFLPREPDPSLVLQRAKHSLGFRDDRTPFEAHDFAFYEQQLRSLLTTSPPVARAATARGGLLAALVKNNVTLSTVLNGPSQHALASGACEVFQSHNGEHFVNDMLFPEELDLLAGVWIVSFSEPLAGQQRQSAYPSYFPPSDHWTRGGYDNGSWSPLGARELQEHRNEYLVNHAQPHRQDFWKNRARKGAKGLRQVFSAARLGAEAFLDMIIESQLIPS